MGKISKFWLTPRRALSRGREEVEITAFDENGQEILDFGVGGGGEEAVATHEAEADPHPQYTQLPEEWSFDTETGQLRYNGLDEDSSVNIGPGRIMTTVPNNTGAWAVASLNTTSGLWLELEGGTTSLSARELRIDTADERYIGISEDAIALTKVDGSDGLVIFRPMDDEEGAAVLIAPREGTPGAPVTLASREWVQANAGGTAELVETTITTGAEVTKLGSLNKWVVTTAVTLTLPETNPGASCTVHVDRLDRITWPVDTVVYGNTDGVEEAWLSLLREESGWVVLVATPTVALESLLDFSPGPVSYGGSDPEEWSAWYVDRDKSGPPEFVSVNRLYDNGEPGEIRSSTGMSASGVRVSHESGLRSSLGHEKIEFSESQGGPSMSVNRYGMNLFRGDGGSTQYLQGMIMSSDENWNQSILELPFEQGNVTAATREWVRGGLSISVATVDDLAEHVSDAGVPAGSSTFVESIDKPVWKTTNETFVDALGTQVYPE